MSQYDINELLKTTKSGKPEDLLKKLSAEDAEKIKNVLANKELTEKLLNSAKAQELIKKFMKEGNKNG
jgi:hypothetical protein